MTDLGRQRTLPRSPANTLGFNGGGHGMPLLVIILLRVRAIDGNGLVQTSEVSQSCSERGKRLASASRQSVS
jgi:hypothetical protein